MAPPVAAAGASAKNSTSFSHTLMGMPLEVRANIISLCINQTETVTVSAAMSPNSARGAFKHVNGLGYGWMPIVSRCYDDALLASAHMDNLMYEYDQMTTEEPLVHPTALCSMDALSLTCVQLNNEVKHIVRMSKVPQFLNMHLTFPYGVCALMQYWPNLLTRTKSLKVSGTYDMLSLSGESGITIFTKNEHENAKIDREFCKLPDRVIFDRQEARCHVLARMVQFLFGRRAAAAMDGASRDRLPAVGFTVAQLEAFMRSRGQFYSSQVTPRLRAIEMTLPWPTTVMPILDYRVRIFYPCPDRHRQLLRARFDHPPGPERLDKMEKILGRRLPPNTVDMDLNPDHDSYRSYSLVFGMETNPSVGSLHEIVGGHVNFAVTRGINANGIEFRVSSNGNNGRYLDTRWPSEILDGDKWAIDPAWREQAAAMESQAGGDARIAVMDRIKRAMQTQNDAGATGAALAMN